MQNTSHRAQCVVVLSFKFDQNRLNGYGDVRVQNLSSSCITLVNGLYKMAAVRQIGFSNSGNINGRLGAGLQIHNHAKFC